MTERETMTGWCVKFRYHGDESWMFFRSSRGGLDAQIHLAKRHAELEARRAREFHRRQDVRVIKMCEVKNVSR